MDDESGEYAECSLATHGADDESGEYAVCSLATHGADGGFGEYAECLLATHVGWTDGQPGDLDERAHGASREV
ncbi:hypothetical protein PF011_g26979 [Phytophthora fragariae]|uniref:Uncharacterized protein n=1 Tax=Phytophthora fragariae TaxID=53985 RepID=A0A6A3HHG5_9STRA|nr:hypothetical protein PF011_g26979 [Phytophthora fragariae]